MLDRWHDTKRGSVTDQTLKAYEIAIRVHLKPSMGSARLQAVRHADLQTMVNRWRDMPGMGPKTVRTCVSVLKQAYGQAVRSRLLDVNPADGLELPSIKRRRSLVVWTPGEVAAFLDKSAGDPLTPLWHLLLLEGMRRSEALGLRWSDINVHPNGRVTAHIAQTVIADYADKGRALVTDRTKTAAGARTVLLTNATARALAEHKDRQAFIRKGAGDQWDAHDLVICTSIGRPINPSNVRRNQRRIMLRAGVSELTTHDLRHTAATTMLLAGVPVKIVSEKLGHSSVTITMDLYSHVLPDMQDQAAAAMDDALIRGRDDNREAARKAAGEG
jgi:integrase